MTDKERKLLAENEQLRREIENLKYERDELQKNFSYRCDAEKFLARLYYLPTDRNEISKNELMQIEQAVNVLKGIPDIWFSTENLPHEVWKPVVNFEEFYQVSNYSRINTLRLKGGRIISLHRNGRNYLQVRLFRDGKKYWLGLHRLVAQAFLPNPENKSIVHHRDSNPLNCCLWNLQWATHSENTKYSFQAGRITQTGLRNSHAKFRDEEMIREIRRMYIYGDKVFGATALAKVFGVTETTIRNIILGKTYTSVK